MCSPAVSAEEHLGLVHACAARLAGRGVEYDDLYQAGCEGLVKAAARFDASRGFCFSTYAVPVILGEMKRLFRDGGAVHISRSVQQLSQRLAQEREQFALRCGREPTIAELAAASGESPEQVSEALCAAMPIVSLSCPTEDGERETDIPVPSHDDKITELLSLRQELGRLPPEDRRLLVLRYFEEKTQSAAAAELGMTQVQVSRRERRLLHELREKLA